MSRVYNFTLASSSTGSSYAAMGTITPDELSGYRSKKHGSRKWIDDNSQQQQGRRPDVQSCTAKQILFCLLRLCMEERSHIMLTGCWPYCVLANSSLTVRCFKCGACSCTILLRSHYMLISAGCYSRSITGYNACYRAENKVRATA